MLSAEVIAHLDAICDANRSRATGECTKHLLRIKQAAGARGVLGSGRTVLLLDQNAPNCFNVFAAKVLEAILDAHAAARGPNALDTNHLLSGPARHGRAERVDAPWNARRNDAKVPVNNAPGHVVRGQRTKRTERAGCIRLGLEPFVRAS
jgi:hypothetical protein